MKLLSKLLLLILVLFVGNSFAIDSKYHHDISLIVDAFKSQDKTAVSALVSYPLNRSFPIPDIENEFELVNRFDEVFDEVFIELIIKSDFEKDWSEVGWRGVSFYGGKIWLNSKGKIRSINNQTLKEKETRLRLIEEQRRTLHSSVREYKQPILEWKTTKFHIRIDDIGNDNYRYSSWGVNQKSNDKPDLVLLDGKVKYIGSGGNHYYLFLNGKYSYRCDVIVIGKDDSPPGVLRVFKGEAEILSEVVIGNLSR